MEYYGNFAIYSNKDNKSNNIDNKNDKNDDDNEKMIVWLIVV